MNIYTYTPSTLNPLHAVAFWRRGLGTWDVDFLSRAELLCRACGVAWRLGFRVQALGFRL